MESRIGFGGVSLGFATDAPCGSAGSFTEQRWLKREKRVLKPYRSVVFEDRLIASIDRLLGRVKRKEVRR